MRKKRYALYVSRPLANRLEVVARQRHGSKSGLLEEALKASLEPEQVPGVEEALARRLNELHRAVTAIGRDVAVVTETLALLVRYFLTITPPLPQSEQEPARLLGRERFDVFVAQVGRRLAENRRLVSEVLETIAHTNRDLFTIAAEDLAPKKRPAAGGNGAHKPATSDPQEGNGDG